MPNKKKPVVSIIIVSFNTKNYLKDCLQSVFHNLKKTKYEVIVVDNASTDSSTTYLKKLQAQKKIKLLCLSENLGYGTANNYGAVQASGKYLLFLNSDTLLKEDPLSPAISYLEKHPSVAAYSCRLTYPNGQIQPTGGYFPTLWRLFAWQFFLDDLPLLNRLISSVHPPASFYHQPRFLDWVTGAFMLVPKETFTQAGGFDERIFLYAEELELCFRLKKLGKLVVYQPKTKIIHFGGASAGSHLAITQEIKNMVYFFKKHYPAWQLPLVKLIFKLGCLLRWFIFGIIGRDEALIKAYRQSCHNLT